MSSRSKHRVGIETGVAVSEDAIQLLIDQLSIGVCELRAALLLGPVGG